MNNPVIIFAAYEPDKNSGGNSMIPYMIKEMNKSYKEPIVYFYISFNRSFKNTNDMWNEMYKYEEPGVPIAKPYMIYDKKNTVIYPEAYGNPLEFTKIVRFNLYFNIYEPNVENEYNIFAASPFLMNYNKIRQIYGAREINLKKEYIYPKFAHYIYNLDEWFNICYDYGNPREESCFMIRKGIIHPHKRTQYNYHPKNSYEIPYNLSNFADVTKIFNKYKYFYTYDGFTNMCQVAMLCGCIPIIVPFLDFKSINEFWEETIYTNGIAYGDSKEEITRAIQTRHIAINDLKIKRETGFSYLFKNIIESIIDHFGMRPHSKLENILLKTNDNVILVYKLLLNVDNNNILILTDKIKDLDAPEYNIEYKNYNNDANINNELYNKKFNYIFSDVPIKDYNYVLKTHFYIDIKEVNNELINKELTNKIKLVPYKYIPQKYINDKYLQTHTNLNIDYNLEIPRYIYDYRPNYGKSRLIWSPALDNISNDHFIIKTINNIGFSHYKRKTNLINVLEWNNSEEVSKNSEFINNDLNICIYQETRYNPLNIKNVCHINWFFDTRDEQDISPNTLFIDQFPLYDIKRNIFRQKYGKSININSYNTYPNCFPVIFNSDNFLKIAKSEEINKYERNNSCFVLRKMQDTHSLRMVVDSISEYFIHPENSLSVDGLSIEDSISLFLRSHTFYCYDLVTFLPVIACLCGCKVIIISNYPGFKDMRDIYKEFNPWMYYGMTYYINNEYIEPEENGRENLINILTDISKNSYKNFSNESSSYNNCLLLLQYLETYFNVTFVE